MANITWLQSFETGIADIDGEHRGLVDIIGAIQDALAKDDLAAALALFEKFIEAAAQHFRREETYLKAIGFPRVESHASAHKELLGMSRALYELAAPHLTVHAGRGGRVDPTKASAAVLAAIPGVTDVDIENLLEARELAAEEDERQEATATAGLRAYITRSRGRVVTIRAEAATTGGVFLREAVVRLTPRGALPYRILAWRQGRPTTVAGPAEE